MRVCKRTAIIALIANLAIDLASPLSADQAALEPPSAKCLAVMQPFGQMAALPVKSRQDRVVGKMNDLLIDLHSGTTLCVLITPSGAADDVVVAVPVRNFPSVDRKRIVLTAAKENLETAPLVPANSNEPTALARTVADAYEHFHQPAVWTGSSAPNGVVRASKLVGYPVRSRSGEDLGTLKDFMVDLQTARVVFSVCSLGGSDTGRYATPPAALTLDVAKSCLVLNGSKAKICESARKGGDLANQMSDPPWAAATYWQYSEVAAGSADATHENVRAKIDSSPATVVASAEPVQAAASAAPGLTDEEIKKRILTAIIRDDLGNAYNYKQLKIVTDNGHVTLQGRARNPKQKAELAKLAESVVGSGNVDNQLELRK